MNKKILLRKTARVWANEYYEEEEFILLKVFRKNLSESYDILIDKEDFERVSEGQWYGCMVRKNTHLKNIINILYTTHKDGHKKTHNIHQWILNSKNKNLIVDHINMNRLDNRRCNLRFVTSQENSLNQINTGWTYNKVTNTYATSIMQNYKYFHLGDYATKEEAYKTYLKACIIFNHDETSQYIKSEIKRLNVLVSESNENNLYIKELIKFKYTGEYKNVFINPNKTNNNNTNKGYNYDKSTNKYLVRISINKKDINIGRYETEKMANEIYLKACIIIGKDQISSSITERIKKYNIKLAKYDYDNKYLKKVCVLYNQTNN